MPFSPLSFVMGLGASYLIPVLARNFRPLAVEATVLGLGLIEDLRRIAAEQVENLEDIAAEVRARIDERANAAEVDEEGADEADLAAAADDTGPEHSDNGARARRRPPARRPRARSNPS